MIAVFRILDARHDINNDKLFHLVQRTQHAQDERQFQI